MGGYADLRDASVSFKEMVRSYAAVIEFGASKVGASVLKAAVGFPDGLPDDVEDAASEAIGKSLEYLALTYLPDSAERTANVVKQLTASLDRRLRSEVGGLLKRYGSDALKLVKAAQSMGTPVERCHLRLVQPGITFAQVVHGTWSWSGTLVEARLMRSEIFVTPAEPGDHFVIYSPREQEVPKTSGCFKVVQSHRK